jgi:hypothetical protein
LQDESLLSGNNLAEPDIVAGMEALTALLKREETEESAAILE